LRQLLGEGGMGQVYLADDTVLNRKVAIKFVSAKSLGSDIAKQRLLREARAVAALDHPNICAIYEIVEGQEDCFIVMQYLEGETLDEKVGHGRPGLSASIDYAIQIADALSEAHSRGVVHRDIKPQNIIVTSRGQLKVLDFGLAKLLPSEEFTDSSAYTLNVLSSPGTMIGTMPYMSPEQVRAEDVDYRSDIFSFGTVMYELITGKQPFITNNRAVTMSAILTQQPLPLSHYTANVPQELERIVSKCLQKDRERRYQSAAEIAIDLRQLQRTDRDTVATGASFHEQPSTHNYLTLAALFGLVLIVGGLAYFLLHRSLSSPPARVNSIAVLPFVNTNADADLEYLSDGMTDSLINSLARLPNTRTIGRTSVFRYKNRDADAHAVGTELGVQSVLSGRITQRGNSFSISVELVDARDNHHIWGQQFNRQLSDILAVQDEITHVITEQLRVEISGEDEKRINKRYTDNSEAYQLYLKGRYFWNKRTPEDIQKGIEYFRQAIAADPNYALAYTGLSDSYAVLGSGGFDTMLPDEAMPKAREAAMKALQIDHDLAEAHASLAYVKFIYDWDWATAETEFNRAIELNANYPTARALRSQFLMAMGRSADSIAESHRAQELDPVSLSINTNVGRAYLLAHEYDKALQQLLKTIEMDPSYVWSHYLVAIAYEQKQMYPQAVEEFQKVRSISGGAPFSDAALAHCYAVSGRRVEALDLAKNLESRTKQTHTSPYYLAIVYAGLDDRDRAFHWLETSYQERRNQTVYIKVEPAFDQLHADKRFTEMMRRVGLSP